MAPAPSIRQALTAILLLLCPLCARPIVAGDSTRAGVQENVYDLKSEFNIGSQPLGQALRQFALQGDIQVLFSEEDVDGEVSPGVRGSFFPGEAIARLISGSS